MSKSIPNHVGVNLPSDDPDILVHVSQVKVGMILKACKEDGGRYYRADVIDVAEMIKQDSRESVKVHWWGDKPSLDRWIQVEDCRLIRQFEVKWEDIKAKLPLAQDPESRAARKKVFEEWNTRGKEGSNATLTRPELAEGIRRTLAGDIGADVEEASKATQCAWKLSRNLAPSKKRAGTKSVDLKEFHAFLTAFRCYLELAELFEHLDAKQEDDQKLSLRECLRGKEQLAKWGISERVLEDKFQGMESWTPKWKFEDFAKFCIEKRWDVMNLDLELDTDDEEVQLASAVTEVRDAVGLTNKKRQMATQLKQNRMDVMLIFKKWDLDYSGKITEAELATALGELNPALTPEIASRLVQMADANNDGFIDYEEFCLWVFAPSVDDASNELPLA